jgi:hypothetical protein
MNKGLEIYNSRYGQNMQLLLPVAYYSECGFVPEVLTRYVIWWFVEITEYEKRIRQRDRVHKSWISVLF